MKLKAGAPFWNDRRQDGLSHRLPDIVSKFMALGAYTAEQSGRSYVEADDELDRSILPYLEQAGFINRVGADQPQHWVLNTFGMQHVQSLGIFPIRLAHLEYGRHWH